MKWEALGHAYPILKIELDEGESVVAETGAMMAIKGSIKVDTVNIDIQRDRSKIVAFLEAIARKIFAGETVMHNVFTGPGEVWFSPSLPGNIKYLNLENKCWIIQDYSYVAHHGNVDFGLTWKGPKGLVMGDLIWLKLCGDGGVWLSSYGDMIEVELKEGEEMIVDNMHFVALPEDARWTVEKFGNMKEFLFSGEGYVIRIYGPVKVILQTRILPPLAAAISRFLPSKWDFLLRYLKP